MSDSPTESHGLRRPDLNSSTLRSVPNVLVGIQVTEKSEVWLPGLVRLQPFGLSTRR